MGWHERVRGFAAGRVCHTDAMASSGKVELGYALSSEEHAPLDLVAHARRAEESGFTFALVSDHFHPWIDAQGQSPFVWSVLGGIAMQTERLRIGTGVTCPMIRMHPAIVAQAAATSAAMLPGRFFLGVGTGENLNEHVLGDRWPPTFVRREMLREAVEVMRELWQGEPDEPPGDALHRRERPALHAARGATGDHGRRERAEGGRARRRDRRRARRDRPRPRARHDLRQRGRQRQAEVRAADRLLGRRTRTRRSRRRTRSGRTRVCGERSARSCRSRATSSRRRRW